MQPFLVLISYQIMLEFVFAVPLVVDYQLLLDLQGQIFLLHLFVVVRLLLGLDN